MQKLSSDIDSLQNMCSDLKITQRELDELKSLFKKYIEALIDDSKNRFNDKSEILLALSVLDPLLVPEQKSPDFKEYGVKQVKTLAEHSRRKLKLTECYPSGSP